MLVGEDAQSWRGKATGVAASAGVPTASAVTYRFGNTIAGTVTSQSDHIGVVNTGERQVKQEGVEQQSAVKTSVDPKQSLLGDAMGNAADTVAGWGSDALNTVVGTLPSVSHDHAQPKIQNEERNTASAPKQPQHFDLSTPSIVDRDGWPDDVRKPPADIKSKWTDK